MNTIRTAIGCTAAVLVAATAFAELSKSEVKRLNESTAVLSQWRNSTDGAIPEKLWRGAKCVIVIPSLKKAAFIVGGESGVGVMSCRRGSTWSAPIFMEMTKGSVGLQVGAQSVELVLLVMNQRGVDSLLRNKVTLGADVSIAAGPVGRSASAAADAQMSAEMLSYSQAKGVFAGIDLSGGSLKPASSANERAYGAGVSARAIALGEATVRVPNEAQGFMTALGAREVRGTSGKQ